MDSIELEGCIDMLKQFDVDNPRGSLQNDSPHDKVAYDKTQRSKRWTKMRKCADADAFCEYPKNIRCRCEHRSLTRLLDATLRAASF
jgi:hypothetical protein